MRLFHDRKDISRREHIGRMLHCPHPFAPRTLVELVADHEPHVLAVLDRRVPAHAVL
jgi:hypothetical protein